MSFGETLQRLRKAAGLSQTELAAKSGMRIDSLRNWEQGRAMPKVDAAHKLATALGVSLDELAVDMHPAQKPAKKTTKRKGKA